MKAWLGVKFTSSLVVIGSHQQNDAADEQTKGDTNAVDIHPFLFYLVAYYFE